MDPISSVFMTFGVILIVAGWILLIITSFEEDFAWGLATLFVPPLSYLYSCFSLEKTKASIVMTGSGVALVLFGL